MTTALPFLCYETLEGMPNWDTQKHKHKYCIPCMGKGNGSCKL